MYIQCFYYAGTASASSPEAQILIQAQQTLLQQGQQLQQVFLPAPDTSASAAQGNSASQPQASTPAPTSMPMLSTSSGFSTPTRPIVAPQASMQSHQAARASASPALAHQAVNNNHSTSQVQNNHGKLATTSTPAQGGDGNGDTAPDMRTFEEREWDWDKELGGSTNSSNNTRAVGGNSSKRRLGRGKPASKTAAAARSSKERTKRERYLDVETYWCSLQPAQRMELLKVPLGPVLQRMRSESGQDAVQELVEGLVLLQDQCVRETRLWTCAMCDQRFLHPKDFLRHVEVAHEEVAVQGGKYVVCGKCQVEVVGMYYTSTCVADYNLCARCFNQELTK